MSFLPFCSLETWTLLVAFACLFVHYGRKTHGVFERLGVPGPKPWLYWGTLCRHSPVYYLDDTTCAKKYGRVFGQYELRKPVLAVMEPEMLKTILVKECFSYFTNRRNFGLNSALLIPEDDEWRRTRNHLSPSFTSRHIKEMFTIMKHHSSKLTDSLRCKAHDDEVISVKDYLGGYSMDVLASCLLGLDTDTVNNPSSPFRTHAASLFRVHVPTFFLQGFFPFLIPLLNLLGVSLFKTSPTDFFKSVIERIRASRSETAHQKQRDFLQDLIDTQTAGENDKDAHKTGLSDHEIFSQITSLFAGYDTTATTLTLLAYTLARNPEAMQRLQTEIDATFPNKEPVQFEPLMQMEYLDSVVNECLRLYPPFARLERVAKETVSVNGVTIPKDTLVMVPVFALHRDPELWPEPEEFRPDRFNKENKQNIKPFAFLPFGAGPRNCLGMRFVLALVKLALAEVLQLYSFSVCEETEIPLQMDPSFIVGPLRPIKLKVQRRPASSADEERCD